jgi:hypothetical protein
MRRSAVIDSTGAYRYRLDRAWGHGGERLVFIMLNPSIADGLQDDPTIRRCIGFAQREGYSGLVVVNLFGLRATIPAELGTVEDPVGTDNYQHISTASETGKVVVAWGSHPFAGKQASKVAWALSLGGRTLWCLGTTKAGAPRHPLYVRGDQPLIPWEPPQ